ncbi:RTA1 like protein-domain-containing protein [Penicillium cf. griseofulvum]|uniref:RTA1 like protein-domain-containing protein n=1 Tax=Penicillium cf. griseofulvum TaxID=2972120 RepID=A0A9W9J0Z9_9EURO|nr:RTA1 like protein-domain-containing protein [Penicillium cf. griseofulvum]KAJ5434379.1 RTA1 like protein-domain-containing protein [Penicillium cf. griseofulvum]KAJ5452210.1 RTA1 like protein-domain-containing protein [Penicillium cf. griseofulvum]
MTGISTPYDYAPSLAVGIAFCAIFGISMLAHIYQASWARMWCDRMPSWRRFKIQIATLIIGVNCPQISSLSLKSPSIVLTRLTLAPTFFTAGIYVILGRLIHFFGQESFLLSPKMYLWAFCTCDLISLSRSGSRWRPCGSSPFGSEWRYEARNGHNGGGYNLPNGSHYYVYYLCG